MVLFDQAVEYPAMRGQGSDCRLFVLPHEAAVAVDVGTEDGGELAFHTQPLQDDLARYRSCQIVPTQTRVLKQLDPKLAVIPFLFAGLVPRDLSKYQLDAPRLG